jgi:hypothetical protein
MVFISQLENIQTVISSSLSGRIPATFYLTMGLSLIIFILLAVSTKYIRKLKRSV